MSPLIFFGIVLVGAILIGVFFENFALDVKSGRQKPPTPRPRRPQSPGPGQTKIWHSQLMHAEDKRPKPKPSRDMTLSDPGAAKASAGGQTKIWRSQKEYRSEGLPKPRPNPGMASSEPTRAQHSSYEESLKGPSRFNRAQKSDADEAAQQFANGTGETRHSYRKAYSADERSKSRSRQSNPTDRQTPPRATQRSVNDRPMARPGQAPYSARRRTQADPSRPNKQIAQPSHPQMGSTHLGKSADGRSARRPSRNPYSADDATRIQFTDRLRPIDQPRRRSGASGSSNSAQDSTSRNPFPSRQQPSNRAQNQSAPSEPFNPADYEQTYIGPFLDEDAIEALNLEGDSPPPDVTYQETHLGPFLDEEVIEEIQGDEIEELKLEGDVRPFDSAYYDETYIGSSASSSSVDDRTHIAWQDNPTDPSKTKNELQPLNSEEDSTLLWRRSEENSND